MLGHSTDEFGRTPILMVTRGDKVIATIRTGATAPRPTRVEAVVGPLRAIAERLETPEPLFIQQIGRVMLVTSERRLQAHQEEALSECLGEGFPGLRIMLIEGSSVRWMDMAVAS